MRALVILFSLMSALGFAADRCNLSGIRDGASRLKQSSQHFMSVVQDVPAYQGIYYDVAKVNDEVRFLVNASQCTVAFTNFRQRLIPKFTSLEGKYLQVAHHYPDQAVERGWNQVDADYQYLAQQFQR